LALNLTVNPAADDNTGDPAGNLPAAQAGAGRIPQKPYATLFA